MFIPMICRRKQHTGLKVCNQNYLYTCWGVFFLSKITLPILISMMCILNIQMVSGICDLWSGPLAVKFKLMLYADDSVLLVSDKNLKVVSDTLSRELETCNVWLIDNRLSLHLGKTEAMLCGTKGKIKNREGFGVKCMNTPIETVPIAF